MPQPLWWWKYALFDSNIGCCHSNTLVVWSQWLSMTALVLGLLHDASRVLLTVPWLHGCMIVPAPNLDDVAKNLLSNIHHEKQGKQSKTRSRLMCILIGETAKTKSMATTTTATKMSTPTTPQCTFKIQTNWQQQRKGGLLYGSIRKKNHQCCTIVVWYDATRTTTRLFIQHIVWREGLSSRDYSWCRFFLSKR